MFKMFYLLICFIFSTSNILFISSTLALEFIPNIDSKSDISPISFLDINKLNVDSKTDLMLKVNLKGKETGSKITLVDQIFDAIGGPVNISENFKTDGPALDLKSFMPLAGGDKLDAISPVKFDLSLDAIASTVPAFPSIGYDLQKNFIPGSTDTFFELEPQNMIEGFL